MKGLLFTFALTYGGAIASFVRPYYGFLIYVAFGILRPESLWWYSLPNLNYSRTIALAFLVGWLLNGAGTWNFGRATYMVFALCFFWVWLLVQAPLSPNSTVAWAQFISLSKVYLPVIAGMTLIDSVAKLKQLAWVIVGTQGFLALEFNTLYYTTYFVPDEWTFASLDNNGIAITMVTSAGLAFFLGMHAPKWWQKGIAFLCAALMAHVVLFSMSRGGMLAMGITGIVSFILIPKRPIHVAMFVVACLLVLRLAGEGIQEEFSSSFGDYEEIDGSAQSRFDLTRDALDCMLKNPLMGCGMENWGNIALQYGWPQGKEAHNTWAQLGAELGVPGFLSIVAFYFFGCWELFKVAREKRFTYDPWLQYFARMVIAAIAGFFVSASLVTVEGVELPYYIMVLGGGALKLRSMAPSYASLRQVHCGVAGNNTIPSFVAPQTA